MKIIIHFILMLCILAMFSCSSSKWQVGEERTVEGIIYITGNAPFTKLALDLGEGNYCILICNSDQEKLLRSNLGQKMKLRAHEERELPDGFAVTVLEVISDSASKK
jgi:hypothetical protein